MKNLCFVLVVYMFDFVATNAQTLLWKPVSVSGYSKGGEMIFEYVADKVFTKDRFVGYLTTICAIQNVPELIYPNTNQAIFLTFVNLDDTTQTRDVRLDRQAILEIVRDSSVVWKSYFSKATVAKNSRLSMGYRKVILPKVITDISLENMFVQGKPSQLDTSKGIWLFAFNTDYGFENRDGESINVYWDANSLRVDGDKIGFSYLMEYVDKSRPVVWLQTIVQDSSGGFYSKSIAESKIQDVFTTAQSALAQQNLWYSGATKLYHIYWEMYATSKEWKNKLLQPNDYLRDYIVVRLRYLLRLKVEQMSKDFKQKK